MCIRDSVRVQGYPGHKARVLLIAVVVIGGTEHVHVVAVRYSVAAVAVGSLIHRCLLYTSRRLRIHVGTRIFRGDLQTRIPLDIHGNVIEFFLRRNRQAL